MPPRQNESYVIKPAAPDTSVRGLLVLPFAQTLPLSVGDLYSGRGREGDYTLIASVRGSLTVTTHTQYFLLDAGQVLAMRCGEPYTIQSVSDCLCMEVHLQGELADRLIQERMENGVYLFSGCAPAVRETVMALSVLEEENPPVSGELASSYAYSLLMQLCGAKVQQDAAPPPLSPLVESAIAIIQEEFPFLEGLDELAERLEVSKAHLSRSFVKKTGISPGKYITRVRIEYAKLLLRAEDVSIAYVAEASGFANANYFAKAFRRETGMSPSEYLESAPRRQHTGYRLEERQPLW